MMDHARSATKRRERQKLILMGRVTAPRPAEAAPGQYFKSEGAPTEADAPITSEVLS
jgi:hypothetical protein